MNSNLFERKNFLDGSWMTANSINYFSKKEQNDKIIVQVNLLRATANEANALKKYLRLLSSQSANPIIIDLSSCCFIDSTFLSTILNFNKSVKNQVRLVVEDSRQLTILRITKIDSIFNIFPNLTKALND